MLFNVQKRLLQISSVFAVISVYFSIEMKLYMLNSESFTFSPLLGEDSEWAEAMIVPNLLLLW